MMKNNQKAGVVDIEGTGTITVLPRGEKKQKKTRQAFGMSCVDINRQNGGQASLSLSLSPPNV